MNIKVDFLDKNTYYISATTELYRVDVVARDTTLDDAIGIAKDLILHHNFVHADILDNCGVVIAEVYKEEKSDDDDCRCYNPYEEFGFNPYLGDYDYDC